MSSYITQRCPRCGNENRKDSYQCSFCGFRLREEKIEEFYLFKRIEREFNAPFPWYIKIYYLLTNPALAFWDINHKRDKSPGFLIYVFSSILYGLIGAAFFSHYQISAIQDITEIGFTVQFFYGLSFFAAFLLFGFIYQLILFAFLIWIFGRGANLAVDFSERLESRFGELEEDTPKYRKAEMSPFSVYRGGVLQQQASHKFKMLLAAFTPFLIINTIKIFVVLFGLPNIQLLIPGDSPSTLFDEIFNHPVWLVLDILDFITVAIWVPILITVAIRELSNSSTYRVLISSLSVGIIIGFFLFLLKRFLV
jgi:ribosomal protein L37E